MMYEDLVGGVMLRRGVLLFMLPAVVACSGRGQSAYPDLESPRHAVAGVEGRRCYYITEPEVPPSLDPVTRPGTRGAILLWASDAAPTDTVDVSVRYGADGRLVWVRAIRSNVPVTRRVELERILSGGLAEDGPSDWGLRVRVAGGQVAAVLPSVVCPPERGTPTGRLIAPVATHREILESAQARGRQIELAVALDAQGRVTDIALVRSSGSRLVDQYALDLARSSPYSPKLHDGVGVPSTLPVQLRVRRR
jgi:TonB family protein